MSVVGFIGLGNMGGPMAANLIKAGHKVQGFDIEQDRVRQFEKNGGDPVNDIREISNNVDFVITMLPAGSHVRSVYLETCGVIASFNKNTLLIDCSTIDVATAREVAAEAKRAGLIMLDAPVSGGVMGAEAASLTIMVGGNKRGFEQATSLLSLMGKNVIYTGSSGNGQVAKMCNNLMLGVSMIGVSEAFVLAEKLGLDHQKLYDISSSSSGQCWSLTSYCPVPGPVPNSPANRNYQAGFTVDMMLKDLQLSQESAKICGVETPMGAKAASLYDQFEGLGNGYLDFSGIIRLLRNGDS